MRGFWEVACSLSVLGKTYPGMYVRHVALVLAKSTRSTEETQTELKQVIDGALVVAGIHIHAPKMTDY